MLTSLYSLTIEKVSVKTKQTLKFDNFWHRLNNKVKYRLAAINILTGLLLPFNPNVNGTVNALEYDMGLLFAGGSFSKVNDYLAASSSAIVSTAGAVNPIPEVDGIINVTIPDGAGGWYVGGIFTTIGGELRRGLARVNSDGSIHAFNPTLNTEEIEIYSLLLDGSTLYVGGDFNSATSGDTNATFGGHPRQGLVAVDTTLNTNNVTSWTPVLNGAVSTMALSGTNLYAGGNFSQTSYVNSMGTVFDNLGNLNYASPNISGWIFVTIPDGAGGWYVGGEFTSVNGQPRNGLARINSDGSLHAFNPDIQTSYNGIRSLLLDGSTLYFGGNLLTVDGQSRSGLAAVNTSTGNVTSWDPHIDGSVLSMALNGTTLYAGGIFSKANAIKSMGALFDIATGGVISSSPEIRNGNISVTIPDGAGGWYIGGDFTVVNGQTRKGLARINGDGSLHAFNVAGNFMCNGTCWSSPSISSLVLDGTTLYVAGVFDVIGGQNRRGGLAAVDVNTGNVTAWNPDPDSNVQSIALDGTTLYVGGDFSNIGGLSRYGLAALDTTVNTNMAKVWNPNPDGPIRAMAVDGSTLYVGGYFYSIGGQSRSYIAALDTTVNTNMATAWDPQADEIVDSFQLSGTTLYVGGSFTSIGGQSRNYIAALDTTVNTNMATAWDPQADDYVETMWLNGTTLYVGGGFTSIGGGSQGYLAALDTTVNTNMDLGITYKVVGNVTSVSFNGTDLFVGSTWDIDIDSGLPRTGLVALNTTINTNNATAWNPGSDGSVQAMVFNGTTLYVGGDFLNIGGQYRYHIAALDTTVNANMATGWDPQASGYGVNTMLLDGSTLYVGGNFTSIGGNIRANIAALDLSTGLATAWNPQAYAPMFTTPYVMSLALSGTTMYVAGQFNSIGGQSRAGFAALDTTVNTNNATAYNPMGPAGYGQTVSLASGGELFVGGSFGYLGSKARDYLAAFDTTQDINNTTAWNPGTDSSIRAMAVDGTTLYVGGWFSNIGGQARNYIAALDTTVNTNNAMAWDPDADGSVQSLLIDGTTLYVGGGFSNIGGQARQGLAALDMTTNSNMATAWDPAMNSGGYINGMSNSGSTLYVSGWFTSIGGQLRTGVAALDMTTNTNMTTSWNPSPVDSMDPNNTTVNTVSVSGSNVYVGGYYYDQIGGTNRSRLAAFDTTLATGNATTWAADADNTVQTLALNGTTLYVGGNFNTVGGQTRNRIAALDTTQDTNNVTAWDPNANNIVYALNVSGTTLYAGGQFTNIGGSGRNRIAALDMTTNSNMATAWNPGAQSTVRALARDGTTLYVGGQFTNIGGANPRNRLAALDTTVNTNNASAWNPNPNNTVFALGFNGKTVYAGGQFTSIGGQTRNRLAALDSTVNSNMATSWNPNMNNIVRSMAISSTMETLFAGGLFTSVNGNTNKQKFSSMCVPSQ